MRFGSWVGSMLVTKVLERAAGWKDLHVQLVVTDERNDFAVGIEGVARNDACSA